MALPSDFKITPSGSSRYMKLEEGENKFRILAEGINGVEGWVTEEGKKRPVRAKDMMELPDLMFDTAPKEFLAFVVWDRKAAEKKKAALSDEDRNINPVKILEITQRSILKDLAALEADDDWGDACGYDIKVTKTGKGMETRYSTQPVPHKPLTPDITGALKLEKINLEALFEGGNPFPKEDKGDDRISPEELPF